jgi:hypothetical protein
MITFTDLPPIARPWMLPVALRHMGRTSGVRQLHQVAGEPVRLAVAAPSDSSGDWPRNVSGLGFQVRFQPRVSTVSASPANLDGVGQPSEERTVAQTLSVNIESPVAGALGGPVVHVSGTVSVVSSGPPFGHQVDRVTVQVGTGSQVTAQVTGPDLLTAANLCGTTSADTAFGRWRARKTLIDGELATIVDALTSSGGTLAGFDGVVQGQLSGPDLDFTTLSKNDAAGEDISSDLAAPGLTVPAFRFLASVRAVHPTSTPLAGERRDVASVVVQARKIVMRYATWRAEERGAVRGRSGRHPVRPGAAERRSLRLGRLATYFGRSGPAGRSPVRKRHARLPACPSG